MLSKKFVLVLVGVLCASLTWAQFPGARGGGNMNAGRFYGKVVDINGKAVEAASVQLLQNKMDTVSKKRIDAVVSGMLTKKNGEFSLEGLNVMGQYKLRISAIGYKTLEQKAIFEINMNAVKSGDMSSLINAVDKDLGNIKIALDEKTLEAVTVNAKSNQALTLNIDRKVFNVEKNLTSVGGTAVDVLKNVPSVNVDIDGNVTLRNAAPQIFVDGRPTTLSLDQIPADAIASVELITNPSAKFDASGGGSGILNVVLKKNRKAGYNGNVRASLDSRPRPSFGGDFNLKQDKINFFVAGNIGLRKSLSWVSTDRSNFFNNATSTSVQTNAPVNSGIFAFGRMGFDYFLNNRNTLSFAINAVRGGFKAKDLINIKRDTAYTGGLTASDYGNRKTFNEGNFRNYGATLSFKHNFAKAGKEWTADVNLNKSKNDNEGLFETQYFFSNANPKTPLIFEQSIGKGNSTLWVAQTDFVNPINSTSKIEMGLRGQFRDVASLNNNYDKINAASAYTFRPGLSNDYKFTDMVVAGYVTYAQQIKDFSYQLGLRVESSEYTGDLLNRNQKFGNSYPISVFPSAFLTYKLGNKQDFQLNYTRKVNRPNFFQVIPFFDYSDPLNISVGNANLVPEFTNLLELAWSYQINKNHSMLATVYGRNTNDLITRYQYKDTFAMDSVLITSFVNANSTNTIGLELTSKHKIAKWWDLTTNLNLFNTTLKTGALIGAGTNSQFSWFAKLNNSFKLPKNYSIQISGDYQAKTILPASSGGGGRGGGGGMFGGGGPGFGQAQTGAQGYIKPNYGVEIAIKKEFMKNNAASLTLQMNDVFRTKVNASFSSSAFFVQDNLRRRDPQVLRLNFNYRFGKLDASLFKRKNMRGEMEGMQGAQGGLQ